jgi:hypothetical protein
VGAIGAQGEEFVENAMADSRLNPPLTEEMQDPLAQIDAMVAKGQLPGRESMAARRMIEFLSDLSTRRYTMINEMKQAFSEWRANARINQEETPLVYHVSSILELVATTNQSTLPLSMKDLHQLEKSDDDQLCSVEHRNWLSERLGLCGAANNSIAGDVIRVAIIAALATAVARAVVALVALVVITVGTDDAADATAIIVAITGALAALGLGELWSDAWCRVRCDNCGQASGVSALFNGCTFLGIVATGNSFDFNEGAIYRIDENGDEQSDFRVPGEEGSTISFSTRIPSDRPFNVKADIICDGNSVISFGDRWILIDPVRDSPTLNPTLNLTSPPMSNMSYPSGQSLTFSAVINTNGWTYLGWSAPGASPSSGSGRSFSIRYDNIEDNIVARQITFRFRNPCTGATLTLPGDSFLICDAAGGFCPQ